MKYHAKCVMYAISLPAILIMGLVICALLYRDNMSTQIMLENTEQNDIMYIASTAPYEVNEGCKVAAVGFSAKDGIINTVRTLGKAAVSPETDNFVSNYVHRTPEIGKRDIPYTANMSFLAGEPEGEGTANPLLIAAAFLIILILLAFAVAAVRRCMNNLYLKRSQCVEASFIDPLTGIFNKIGFEEKTREAILKLPEECKCAVVAFDVVSFRTYNELYGYDAGDVLLKMIADCIFKCKKNSDIVGRMYSDHFVWFLSDKTSDEIFSTLRNAFKMATASGLPFFLCGGIYLVYDRELPIPDMVDKASLAKNTIKYSFGTGITIYDESMLECQLQDAEMVGHMMNGLQNGEFIDYYQPKFNTDTETIIGAEALVRWKKPDGEVIMPHRFIGLFERNGFIRRLDLYMFEKVCSFLAEAKETNKTVLPVSVNFSRVHMHDANFPQRLLSLTQKYSVEPKNLEIELTETAFIMDKKNLIKVVDKLHEYGFSVAIDDFGSGYSSLNMLKDFDFDTLKIDMKFLEGFERGGKVGTILTSVIRMAKWLGIPVVAEGVETREQIEFLRSLGCEMIQGHYFCGSIPRDEYEMLLAQQGSVCILVEKPTVVTMSGINAILGGDSLINSLLDGILGGFGIYEISGNSMEAIRVNREYYEIMGYPDVAAFSKDSLNVMTEVYPDDADKLLDICNAAILTGAVQKTSLRRYVFDGSLKQFDCLIKHIGCTKDRPIICMTFIDASGRLRAERANELKKYSDVLYGIFDEILEFNFEADTIRFLSQNHVQCQADSKNLEEAQKNWIENLIYPEDREKIEKSLALIRDNNIELPFSSDYRVIKDGEIKWFSSTLVSIAEGSYLLCKLDITQKKQLEKLMEKMKTLYSMADVDYIAGVLNAVSAEKLIKEKMAKSENTDISALLVISLDEYSLIDDVFGHLISNAFVKEVAIRINHLFGENDIVGRIAADKFVIYMGRIDNAPAAYYKAMKVKEYLSDIILPDKIVVDCSIGLCIVFPEKKDYEDALKKAEAALQTARSSRTNHCVIYEEDTR